jgi:hypothetical protein
MTEQKLVAGEPPDRHSAEVALMLTEKAGFTAKASTTTAGLLSIAVLVSSILLSTSIVVLAASRAGKHKHRA